MKVPINTFIYSFSLQRESLNLDMFKKPKYLRSVIYMKNRKKQDQKMRDYL